jgi:tetratricopeptide (TPR) repeat protein
MQSLSFWKTWLKEYRILWSILAAVFAVTLVFLWFSYFTGADGVIHWDTIQEQKTLESTVHQFRLGPFELKVPAESYVIFEYFNGSYVEPNTVASYSFLIVLVLSATLLMAVITTLEGFSYYVGMGLFILFIAGMRLEVLGLFGQFNRLPLIAALLLYLLPAFYFSRFRPAASFVLRWLVFAGITAVLGVVIFFFAGVESPFYHLSLTGYTPALILSVIFILMVAHEIMGSFVYIISQGSSKSLRHFMIISFIYLGNVIVTALHELEVIRWNFIYSNPYLLLTISAILGIWGFRQREALYANMLRFYPFGAYFYLAMAAICFATTAQLLGNNNDAAIRIIREITIFSHAGYGIIFLLYILSNFVVMLAQNMPVYKVLYNPNRMPYFTFRFGGMIATLAFVFVGDWRGTVYNGMAGFYIGAGDMYALQDNSAYAESFYDQARARSFATHRANYALGTMKASRFNFEGAHDNYHNANLRRPSEYSLANDGNVYVWEGQLFDAIQAYREANRVMPASGAIANNLGLAYTKVHNIDSALQYLDAARDHAQSKDAAETNFFAMTAAELLPIGADSVLKTFNSTSPATLANALALSTLYNQPFTQTIDPLAQRTLNLHTATLLNNYIIRHVKTLDTTFTAKAYRVVSDSVNFDYAITLKSALAYAFYHQGNVTKALEILAEQVYMSQADKGKFNYIMGLWALEQGNPERASDYFTYADTYDYKKAKFYNAIALTEAGRTGAAMIAWDTVRQSTDESEAKIANTLKRILALPAAEATALRDGEKYQFCRYRIGLRDSVTFDRLINTFENANYKALALLDISRKYYQRGMYSPAIRFFNRIAGLEISDKQLYDDVRHFELRMLASRHELSLLARQINKGVEFTGSRLQEKMLYAALISEASGDTTTAYKNYSVLGRYNPYFEEGIIAAADFFRKKDPKGMRAYTILSEAIQVNSNSYRLLHAYAAEAARKGFDEYTATAVERLQAMP